MVDAPGREAVCTDADVAYATVVALQRPPDRREARAARRLAERCWDALGTAVVENVAHETADSYYLHNACPIRMEHKAMTGLRATRRQALSSRWTRGLAGNASALLAGNQHWKKSSLASHLRFQKADDRRG
jgi:hypothetical protein